LICKITSSGIVTWNKRLITFCG